MDQKTFLMAGVALALLVAVAAPFLASGSPDGLESAFFGLYGAKTLTGSELDDDQAEVAEEEVVEKTGNDFEFASPMPDYTVEGWDKAGEVVAVVLGTLLMLGLVWGLGRAVAATKQ
ncbi:MAG: cobalt transporter [Methanomicrobiales archaeon]|nr:cobalt transporter [Methanomicrobiales archaeon]